MASMQTVGLALPEILLPAPNIDLHRWSVIACDQFTSDPDYWKEVAFTVEDSPSTLNLILPEVYLEDRDIDSLVPAINAAMEEYLDTGVLVSRGQGWVLVDRSTSFVPSRKGLVVAIDLECYDFEPGATSLVRPTEGTVLDRLPPRMSIRRDASLDLPHILVLIDDPDDTVIGPIFAIRDKLRKLYDFNLQQGGGHISGWLVDELSASVVVPHLEALIKDGLLYAVGDGNHSLATARQLWLEKKAAGAADDDPARYAMVELENIHDEGLLFHPIHRVLFDVEREEFIGAIQDGLGGVFEPGDANAENPSAGMHTIGIVTPNGEGTVKFEADDSKLTVEFLQPFLDEFLEDNSSVSIDYVHDHQPVRDLGSQEGNIGIYLPEVDKSTFFDRIRNVGPYPRKTFSIGESPEKRYYLEARKLKAEPSDEE